jgi:hypothetical protein
MCLSADRPDFDRLPKPAERSSCPVSAPMQALAREQALAYKQGLLTHARR